MALAKHLTLLDARPSSRRVFSLGRSVFTLLRGYHNNLIEAGLCPFGSHYLTDLTQTHAILWTCKNSLQGTLDNIPKLFMDTLSLTKHCNLLL